MAVLPTNKVRKRLGQPAGLGRLAAALSLFAPGPVSAAQTQRKDRNSPPAWCQRAVFGDDLPELAIAPEVAETVVITDGLEVSPTVEVADNAVAAVALVAELALAVKLPNALHFLTFQTTIEPVGLALEAVFPAVIAPIIAPLITPVSPPIIVPFIALVSSTILARFLALLVPLGDALGQGTARSEAQQSACEQERTHFLPYGLFHLALSICCFFRLRFVSGCARV